MAESENTRLTPVFQGVILALIVVMILYFGRPLILPFMIALFLTLILDPVVQLLVRRKIPLGISVLLTILATFFVLYVIGLAIYASMSSFSDQFPFYERRILGYVNSLTLWIEGLLGYPLQASNLIDEIDWVAAIRNLSVTQRILSSIGSFVSFLGNGLLVFIFLLYLLFGKQNLLTKIQRAFDSKRADSIMRIVTNVNSQVQVYLGTKTVVSLATAILSLIVFMLFGLDFAIIWAFLIFVLNFIPNFGSIVASILPLLIALVQFDSGIQVLWLALALSVIQLGIGNGLEPRLMGKTLNLSPLMVILSLIFWGWLWGVAGMILAVPILATLTIIFENIEGLKFISVFLRGDQNVVYYNKKVKS